MSSNASTSVKDAPSVTPVQRLPWVGLLALAMAGFICILTESLPAGLLPQMANDLQVSEALAGQFVTLYAAGSLIAAIPLTTATRGWRRRPLMLLCLFGFLVCNTVTALSSDYLTSLAARFFAGVSAGVLWGMTAGYARRMVPDWLKGRAVAVAMVGTPLALALGIPMGTYLGDLAGWRPIFGAISLLAASLMGWMLWKLPDYEGEPAQDRLPVHRILLLPGVLSILFVVLAWVLAHNLLYTYISPFLATTSLADGVDLALLLFGFASVIGIGTIGLLIDRFPRGLVLCSLAVFALSSAALGFGNGHPAFLMTAVFAWGLTFGGAATLLQTAIAKAGGKSADVAQSILVTAWNLGIGGGGMIGGFILHELGATVLPVWVGILALLAWIVAWQARRNGFSQRTNELI